MGSFSILPFLLVLSISNLVPNGGFENGLTGWGSLWTRDPNVGKVVIETQVFHTGKQSARIEHQGAQDWSFNPNLRLSVKPGDLFTLDAWVKVQGSGSGTICVIAYDKTGTVVDWIYAERTLNGDSDWRALHSRFVIPGNVTQISPRLIGVGVATVWLDDFSLVKEGNVHDQAGDLPKQVAASNAILSVTCNTEDGTLSVWDHRTNQSWRQKTFSEDTMITQIQTGDSIQAQLVQFSTGLSIQAVLRLESDKPEFTLTFSAVGPMSNSFRFPHPFVTEAGTYLVAPMNEGISYPVEDQSIEPMSLVAYGGHGICMAFWGVTDGKTGCMAILETPDDVAIRIERLDRNLCILPEWQSQKGQFGYPRRIRYIFFADGGHVAMCKRYRAYAQSQGLFKTLEQKQKENPNVDRLIGAVNFWCWESNALAIAREMQSLGIQRILWSNQESPSVIQAMNDMGILTSRYDIYQDVMDPAKYPLLQWTHSDWPAAAWPNDLMIDENGNWRKGWEVEAKDGSMIPCGVLCDKTALKYARERIPPDLSSHPYRCRFIDTTTASPWRECYHPDHPLTRSESRHQKMELLRYVSEEMKLVTGSETGHDAATPFVHYFEGMLSLGPYRVPDAGRRMQEIWTEIPDVVAKFQLGQKYRLPLWELVYHDCVVAQWYWGDYNNKLPALWNKRDLFNILYGTPPMFMFTQSYWNQNKNRFAQSYKNISPVVRSVGYAEMTDHRFLTPDRNVQQTVFSNGIKVTVNFGAAPYRLSDTVDITSMNFYVEGIDSSNCRDWNQHE